jgi:hypothetical protein
LIQQHDGSVCAALLNNTQARAVGKMWVFPASFMKSNNVSTSTLIYTRSIFVDVLDTAGYFSVLNCNRIRHSNSIHIFRVKSSAAGFIASSWINKSPTQQARLHDYENQSRYALDDPCSTGCRAFYNK